MRLERVHPSINRWTLRHWSAKNREKKDWADTIGWELKVQKLWKKIPAAEVTALTITYFMKENRRRDKDNYAPKFILDGLKEHAAIVDDNSKDLLVDWGFEKLNEKNPYTIIKFYGNRKSD